MGQLLQGDAEIAVVVQTGGQVAHDLRHALAQPQLMDLPGEKAEQSLLQSAVAGQQSQGVQLVVVHPLIEAVLVVVVLQPFQLAQQVVLLAAFGGGGGDLIRLHQRVAQRQLADIGVQLLRAQLEHFNALKLMQAETLYLRLQQLHKHCPPSLPAIGSTVFLIESLTYLRSKVKKGGKAPGRRAPPPRGLLTAAVQPCFREGREI